MGEDPKNIGVIQEMLGPALHVMNDFQGTVSFPS
jgi:hypothetical protein